MSRVSFKTYIAEALIEDRILQMVRSALGTSKLDSMSNADPTTLMKAKRLSHKFVDSAEGPWVVEVFTYRGNKFARVNPPKDSTRKATYFFPQEQEEEAMAEGLNTDGDYVLAIISQKDGSRLGYHTVGGERLGIGRVGKTITNPHRPQLNAKRFKSSVQAQRVADALTVKYNKSVVPGEKFKYTVVKTKSVREAAAIDEGSNLNGWSVSTRHFTTKGSDPTRIERLVVSKGDTTIYIEQAFGDLYIYPNGFGRSADRKGPLGEFEVNHFLKAHDAPSLDEIEKQLADDDFEDPMGHPSQYESAVAEAGIPKHHEQALIGPVHSSRKFHYDRLEKTFSTEASTLGRRWKGQLWNDSADEGFVIESARTGDTTAFTSMVEHKDGEGDITHWTFHAYNYSRDPRLNGMKAIVFND